MKKFWGFPYKGRVKVQKNTNVQNFNSRLKLAFEMPTNATYKPLFKFNSVKIKNQNQAVKNSR